MGQVGLKIGGRAWPVRQSGTRKVGVTKEEKHTDPDKKEKRSDTEKKGKKTWSSRGSTSRPS
jgi:hypothetical protein